MINEEKDLMQIGKELVGKEIAKKVQSGNLLGLGTGSTAKCAIIEIGKRIETGEIKDIIGFPTSEETRKLAEKIGIKIINSQNLNNQKLDWGFDGADEIVLASKWAIKGAGGAMTSEKAVAGVCKKLILIVDESKVSKNLGEKRAVPIEVKKGFEEEVFKKLELLGAKSFTLRKNKILETAFITEHKNHIIDVTFSNFNQELESSINNSSKNIVENGLFTIPRISLASEVIVAWNNGEIEYF